MSIAPFSNKHKFINRLGGDITDRDQALQLLLILDYVVDWARDTFRPNFLPQLKMLGSTRPIDPTSFMIDDDIYSMQNFHSRVSNGIRNHDEETVFEQDSDSDSAYWKRMPNEAEQGGIESLHKFETAHGLVRDARRIESHLLGLIITKATFLTIKDSFDTDIQARHFSRDILRISNQ